MTSFADHPALQGLDSEAIGHLQALFNCSVISREFYHAQWKVILDRQKAKLS